MQETEKIWMNGELVDWADAKIHVGSHGLHYGSGVFEGIRCYETDDGPRRLPADRPPAAAPQLGASSSRWSFRTPSRSSGPACYDVIVRERPARVLPAADRVLRVRRARRAALEQPRRRRAS